MNELLTTLNWTSGHWASEKVKGPPRMNRFKLQPSVRNIKIIWIFLEGKGGWCLKYLQNKKKQKNYVANREKTSVPWCNRIYVNQPFSLCQLLMIFGRMEGRDAHSYVFYWNISVCWGIVDYVDVSSVEPTKYS